MGLKKNIAITYYPWNLVKYLGIYYIGWNLSVETCGRSLFAVHNQSTSMKCGRGV